MRRSVEISPVLPSVFLFEKSLTAPMQQTPISQSMLRFVLSYLSSYFAFNPDLLRVPLCHFVHFVVQDFDFDLEIELETRNLKRALHTRAGSAANWSNKSFTLAITASAAVVFSTNFSVPPGENCAPLLDATNPASFAGSISADSVHLIFITFGLRSIPA